MRTIGCYTSRIEGLWAAQTVRLRLIWGLAEAGSKALRLSHPLRCAPIAGRRGTACLTLCVHRARGRCSLKNGIIFCVSIREHRPRSCHFGYDLLVGRGLDARLDVGAWVETVVVCCSLRHRWFAAFATNAGSARFATARLARLRPLSGTQTWGGGRKPRLGCVFQSPFPLCD